LSLQRLRLAGAANTAGKQAPWRRRVGQAALARRWRADPPPLAGLGGGRDIASLDLPRVLPLTAGRRPAANCGMANGRAPL